ncbi:MAG: DNA topoisomerase 3 [Bacteroides sp.]|nr:DNA topoisomerase 3 [Bacteroides sp.]MCM1456730.1 DNA topoisomerase 3 [Lachnoclostridium sp.]
MILCITEKPSVAKDIASILGANVRREGFYEGSADCPYKVTWTFGHLCCLKEPQDYTDMWKRWSLGSLPMIPPKFGIKLIDDKGIERQFRVIETLISEAAEVINCGDAGQEGELIQRWVMQKAGIKCPVRRLWISSLTDESIRKGFSELKPQADFDNLYLAGLSRAIGDWLLGMNATRLFTIKYSGPGKVLSIGRVQTPTLALIVQRHFEIANFKPEDSWELRTVYRDVTFISTGDRFSTEEACVAEIQRLAPLPLSVTDVTKKKGREAPPRLFDLTTLQVECNKKWGWSADETLRLIQSLYEKKVTTYPRVDTTYLTDDIYKKVPDILRRMTPYAPQTAPVLALPKLPKSKKVFDNSKVTDHHAIIPTGQLPDMLVGDERKLYHLIAMRFIAAFYPDCIFEQTTVLAKVDDTEFKATGKVITDPGWRVLYNKKTNSASESENPEAESDSKLLPPMRKGEGGPHTPCFAKKTSQPPKHYNEGTLLRAMESAGRTVDDEQLREAMKENGIGRPSTRAAIIETLFKRKYIIRKNKNILATEAGINLIKIINEELLKSAKLTGIWENKLRRIERGQYSPGEFISELKAMISQIVINVLSDNSGTKINTSE